MVKSAGPMRPSHLFPAVRPWRRGCHASRGFPPARDYPSESDQHAVMSTIAAGLTRPGGRGGDLLAEQAAAFAVSATCVAGGTSDRSPGLMTGQGVPWT
jgi:hypothetical protein